MKSLAKIILTMLLISSVAQARGHRFEILHNVKPLGSLKGQVLRGASRDLSRNLFNFIPNYGVVAQTTPTAEDFSDEQSMYSATIEFARQHGGEITNDIIDKIPDWYYESAANLGLYPNIDVRVHDLNFEVIPEGSDLYPAIPGWHADGEYRETYFSQPDLSRIPVSFHIVSTVSTLPQGVSNTRFIDTAMQMEIVEELPDSALWADVHRNIELLDGYDFTDMRDGGIVMFDARTLHKAMPAKASGKRLFFRMSMWHKPNLGNGQISKQEQLYLLPKPDFKEDLSSSRTISGLETEIIGSFEGTERISHLAQEQSIFGATVDEIKRNGGDISKRLVMQIPADFAREGYVPVVDMLIFRLYPGYRPFFPNYEGKPQSVNWHSPINFAAMFAHKPHGIIPLDNPKSFRKELWMSVSSHESGVNKTEFSDGTHLTDGVMLLTSGGLERRELPTKNRGWRLMMRVRLVPEGKVEPSQLITQQYVDPASEEAGW